MLRGHDRRAQDNPISRRRSDNALTYLKTGDSVIVTIERSERRKIP
jgi:hypothetical protein